MFKIKIIFLFDSLYFILVKVKNIEKTIIHLFFFEKVAAKRKDISTFSPQKKANIF